MTFQWIIRRDLLLLLLIGASKMDAKQWTYTFKSLEGSSSNTDLLSMDLKIARLGRNDFALAGSFDLNYIMPPEETMVEISSYRSLTGNSDFKPLPFSIKRQSLMSFMNGPYKDIIMEQAKVCTNLPYFEGEFEPPFPPGHYEFRNCLVDITDMPDTLPTGFYQVIVNAEGGDLGFNITGIAKIENTMF